MVHIWVCIPAILTAIGGGLKTQKRGLFQDLVPFTCHSVRVT